MIALATIIAASTLLFITPKFDNIITDSLTKEQLECISRQTIIARGQDWVDKHVPYDQGKTHDGYRTDCSGFVSMSW